MGGVVSVAELCYLVLTEDGYTTSDGPMLRDEALAEFGRFAPHVSSASGGRLRVVSEIERRRPRPTGWDEDEAECMDCECCTRKQCTEKSCSRRCPCTT